MLIPVTKEKAVLLALAISMLLSIFSMNTSAQTTNATPTPDHITLTWTQDPMTTQTVTWRTDLTVNSGMVEYAKQTGQGSFPGNARTVTETPSKFDTNTGTINIHSTTITGLEPGVTYVYRVGGGKNWSAVNTFTTEAAGTDAFKFLVFGDSQSGSSADPNYAPWQTNVQNAYKANPDAKFIVNIGDNVETGQNYIHWENWFAAAKGVIDHIPEMSVQGNHETFLPLGSGQSRKPIYWETQFKLPQNGAEGLLGQTYSYEYGNAHFIVLDSQEDEEAPVSGDILAAQKTWLENDLKNTTKTWKIVFFHKAPYYNKATRSNEAIKLAFCPIFDKYHVDLVFNGHDHSVSRTYPMYNDSPVNRISKGTVYYVAGRSGNKAYTDLSQKVWDAFFYDPQDQPNYINCMVNGNMLTLNATKADGTLIDSYVMDKNADTKTATPYYNNTRMVIYGNMLQQSTLPTDPQKVNDKWYVPARAFAQFFGGSASMSGSVLTVSLGGTTADIPVNGLQATVGGKSVKLPDKLLIQKSNTFISADDIKAVFGFSWKYDATTNMIFFTK